MSLSTIGFGDMVPGSYPTHNSSASANNVTVWFCSCYIMSGMALTAMCFNILHDEIVHRLSHHHERLLVHGLESARAAAGADELAGHEGFAVGS